MVWNQPGLKTLDTGFLFVSSSLGTDPIMAHITQDLRGQKTFRSIVVVIVGHPLEFWLEAIDGAMCRRLAVGRQTNSCIGTRIGRVCTIHTVGIRTHFGVPTGWVAIQGSIDSLKVVNQFFFDGGLHLLFWNC